ncbi:CPBP family intramembrane glutamic endopeptidase [Aneurinibacillus terranovensis]|uniref:CPBP family intramembrane glutamic endopeptidase n=1 Tax=Aneurinibacillus terranovensis TaxID=278991 RepID=UPI00138B0CC3|nr:type II CAAX endopeptidase family protein [Aneurinibacillus terranovensis]
MHRQERWEKIALITGVLLVLGYISGMGLEFSSLKWVMTAKGDWKVESSDAVSRTWMLFFLSTAILSVLPAFIFIPALIKTRNKEWPGWERGVSMRYAVYYFALYQVGYVVIQLVFTVFPQSLFAENSFGNLIESFLPQFMMAGIGLLLFYSRLHDIGFVRPVKGKQLILSIILCYIFTRFLLDYLITLPISNLFHFNLDSWREQQISGEVMQAKNIGLVTGVLEILFVGFFVPVAEEMMFRGVLQTVLVERFGAVIGVVGSSFLFAAIHVDPVLFPPLFTLGLMLGWLRHHHRSLWASVLFHALNNTITVCIYFFQ